MRESMLRLPRPQGSFSAFWKSFFADASSSATSQAKDPRGRGTEGKGSGEGCERTEKGRIRWQYFLAKDAWRQEFERLSVAFLPGALHKRELRRLVARCFPHAGRAMRVLPSRRGLQLEEQEARDWLAWSFGVPLDPLEWCDRNKKNEIVGVKCGVSRGAGKRACDVLLFFFRRPRVFVPV